jgi:hypothetical protein
MLILQHLWKCKDFGDLHSQEQTVLEHLHQLVEFLVVVTAPNTNIIDYVTDYEHGKCS